MQSAAFTNAEDPYTYVALVTPMTTDPATSGKIRHLPCAPQVKHKWLVARVVGRDQDGVEMLDFFVEPLAQRAGFVLLRDLYDAEGNSEGWAEYERHMKAIAAGQRVRPFPVEKLPREVRRRRACGAEVEETAAPAAADVTKAVDAVTKGRARG